MSNRTFAKLFVCAAILIGIHADVRAGRIASNGEEVGYWVSRSVIFAEVTEVERLPTEDYFHGTHRLQVRPKATLTGSFDCARMPNLELGAWFGILISELETPPKQGSHIVVVIQKRDQDYVVESSYLTFMPHGAGLVEVKDFSDPLVVEILSNLQSLRRRFPF